MNDLNHLPTKEQINHLKIIIDSFYESEKKHWQELEKPQNHLFNSFRALKKLHNQLVQQY